MNDAHLVACLLWICDWIDSPRWIEDSAGKRMNGLSYFPTILTTKWRQIEWNGAKWIHQKWMNEWVSELMWMDDIIKCTWHNSSRYLGQGHCRDWWRRQWCCLSTDGSLICGCLIFAMVVAEAICGRILSVANVVDDVVVGAAVVVLNCFVI